MSIEIKLRKGEPMDRAIRRLKKTLDREGVIRDVRAKALLRKTFGQKRKARKVAAFTQMLPHPLRKDVVFNGVSRPIFISSKMR